MINKNILSIDLIQTFDIIIGGIRIMEKNKNQLGITLSPEQKKQLLAEIIYYFDKERDERLGIIASENILDFFMDNLGRFIYNKALDDTKVWYTKRMEDVEADFYALYKQEL